MTTLTLVLPGVILLIATFVAYVASRRRQPALLSLSSRENGIAGRSVPQFAK